jgi:hypothetical protein
MKWLAAVADVLSLWGPIRVGVDEQGGTLPSGSSSATC